MDIQSIRHELLSLSAPERAQLAELLLSSLDTLSEAEIEQLWFQEAARRAAEMDRDRRRVFPLRSCVRRLKHSSSELLLQPIGTN